MQYSTKQKRELNRRELEDYRDRLKTRITVDLQSYGFTWDNLVKAFKLSAPEKKELDEQWLSYYEGLGEKPWRPNPVEHEQYLEYLRVENLLSDPHVKMVDEIFGLD